MSARRPCHRAACLMHTCEGMSGLSHLANVAFNTWLMQSLAERWAQRHLTIRREAPLAPSRFHALLFCKLIKQSFGRGKLCSVPNASAVCQTGSGKMQCLWGSDVVVVGEFMFACVEKQSTPNLNMQVGIFFN